MKSVYYKSVKRLCNASYQIVCRVIIIFLLLFILHILCTRDAIQTYNSSPVVVGDAFDSFEVEDSSLDSFVKKQAQSSKIVDNTKVVGYVTTEKSRVGVSSIKKDFIGDCIVPTTISSYNTFGRNLTIIIGSSNDVKYYSLLKELISNNKIMSNFSIEYEKTKSREFKTFSLCSVDDIDFLFDYDYKEAYQFLIDNNCVKATEVEHIKAVTIIIFKAEYKGKVRYTLIGGYVS